MKQNHHRFHLTLLAFSLLFLAGCSGKGGQAANSPSASTSETAGITTTGYLNRGTHFDLYLRNTSDAAVELKNASFIPESNPEDAFELYGWQVGNDSEIVSDTFTGATLAPGVTVTFTIRLMPRALKSHTATFQVFYGAGDGDAIDYDITAHVIKGEPPSGNGDDGGDSDKDDDDSGDDGDGAGDDDDTGGDDTPSDTPAAELSGDKTLKITKMYAYIAKNSPVVGENSAKLKINFDAEGKTFTFYKVTEADGFQIPTAEGGTFSGQPFVVTTTADATGPFESEGAGAVISADNVTLALLATGVNSPVGSDAKEFGFMATIESFTTGEVPIPGDLSEDDVSTMKAGLNVDHEYVSDSSITGTHPAGATRAIALVGCGKIPFSSVKAGSAGKSAFSNPDTILCAIIEGQVLE